MNGHVRFLGSLVLVALFASKGSLAAPTEGRQWLGWTDKTKLEYVEAYLIGYQRGFYEACKISARGGPSAPKSREFPWEECHGKVAKHSKFAEYYVESITMYYRTYSDDQNVAISDLIEGLSDSENLTIQQMHEYYGPSAKKVPIK